MILQYENTVEKYLSLSISYKEMDVFEKGLMFL